MNSLSSSDLNKLVIEALEECWRPVQEATVFEQVKVDGKSIWAPCESNSPHAKKMNFLELTPETVKLPEFSIVRPLYQNFIKDI